MTAVAYIRVSTDDQNLGPEAQRAAIEAWATRAGVHVAAWHVDHGVSGVAPLDKRPALMAAMGALGEHGATTLVAAKRCRIARDVMTAAMAEHLAAKAGARVLTADGVGAGEGPEAQLMRTMVDAFAEYERACIRSRTKAALAAKRAKGERVGGVPYGHRLAADGVRLVDDNDELRVITKIVRLRRAGMTQRAIATELNSCGIPARGKRWYATTVARLVHRTN